ncbi:MAG TPA: hypothetical protein VN736_06155 [Candidatus Limnocylindrales bacterium]|nr:hypothetical protein [Candidatus Limnocylindrales bacterium]
MSTITRETDLQAAQAQLDVEAALLQLKQKEIATERFNRLEAEHQTAVSECRAAKENLQRAREEANRYGDPSGLYLKAMNRMKAIQTDYSNHMMNYPSPSTYPTAEELDAWQRLKDDLTARLEAAEAAYRQTGAEYEAAKAARNSAREEFERLVSREAELRGRLYPNKKSGITIEVIDGAAPGATYRKSDLIGNA